MIRNFKNKYVNETISLDGESFESCVFENCVLAYSGGEPPSFVNNTVINSRWAFIGEAANTLTFLSGLYRGLGKDGERLIEATFESVRRGDLGVVPSVPESVRQ